MLRIVAFFPDRLKPKCELRHDLLSLTGGEKMEGGALWKECQLHATEQIC